MQGRANGEDGMVLHHALSRRNNSVQYNLKFTPPLDSIFVISSINIFFNLSSQQTV